MKIVTSVALALMVLLSTAAGAAEKTGGVAVKHEKEKGTMTVLVDGKEALVYQYGKDVDLPHYYPLRSPAGQLLTVQVTEPYPHHRSFWFADTIELAGQPKMSTYMALYSGQDKKKPVGPFGTYVRHEEFLGQQVMPQGTTIGMKLVWLGESGKLPLMDETREVRFVALGMGEYFFDNRFTLTAAYGDVKFVSDATHYAWPYVRIHPQFSVQDGKGKITNAEGKTNQKETLNQVSRWLDYSGEVQGVTEGLAMFSDPEQPAPRFFTRDYGTCGPRRPDETSGKPFELKKGQSLKQRMGVLVHSGDASAGRVAERYRQYAEGRL